MTEEQRRFIIMANLIELSKRTLAKSVSGNIASQIGSATVYGDCEKLLHGSLQNELTVQGKVV